MQATDAKAAALEKEIDALAGRHAALQNALNDATKQSAQQLMGWGPQAPKQPVEAMPSPARPPAPAR